MKNININAQVHPDYIGWLATRILNADDFSHREFSLGVAEQLEQLAAAIRKGYESEKTDLFPVFDIIDRLWESGNYIKRQDGSLWLFDAKGEGVLCSGTFRGLCVNIILAGLDGTTPELP